MTRIEVILSMGDGCVFCPKCGWADKYNAPSQAELRKTINRHRCPDCKAYIDAIERSDRKRLAAVSGSLNSD